MTVRNKKLQNRLYREIKRRIIAEFKVITATERAVKAEETAERYKDRFRKFGENVETIGGSGYIKTLEWTVKPEQYGSYACSWSDLTGEQVWELKRKVTEQIVNGLMENNLVQFICKNREEFDPLGSATIGAKVNVVPWEQMPHERVFKIREYAHEMAEDEP